MPVNHFYGPTVQTFCKNDQNIKKITIFTYFWWQNCDWSGNWWHYAWWHLGDMLCSSGGCDSAIAARCWGKFGKLLPVLTTRHLSPRIHGKVCEACVRSALLHGSKTWGPNCSGSAAMTVPCFAELWYQRPRWNTISFTTTTRQIWGIW